jgi:hypothetical protein
MQDGSSCVELDVDYGESEIPCDSYYCKINFLNMKIHLRHQLDASLHNWRLRLYTVISRYLK